MSTSRYRKWAAIVVSIVSTLTLVVLGPLVYLFADVLVRQGVMPSYDSLPSVNRQLFRVEWQNTLASNPETAEKSGPSDTFSADTESASWNGRYQAFITASVGKLVNTQAVEHLEKGGGASAGLLATVAANRGHWTAPLLGQLARWNSWTWSTESYLCGLFVIALVLLGMRLVLVNAAGCLAISAAVSATNRIRRSIYTHSLRLTSLAVNDDARNEAADALTSQSEELQNGLVTRLTLGVRAPLLTALASGMLLLIHLWLGLTMLFLCGAAWLVIGQSADRMRRSARFASRQGESGMCKLRENMSHMRLVKAYLMERFNQTRVERHLRGLSQSEARRLYGDTLTAPTIFMIAVLPGLILVFIASRVVIGGGPSVAALAWQVSCLAALILAVHEWAETHARIGRARLAAANVFAFLDLRAASHPIDAEFLQPLTHKLEWVDVSYLEPGTGAMIFDGVTLHMRPGQRVAIVCSTPAETRTFAHIMTRFVDPTGGEIRMDGKNHRWVTLESLRTQLLTVLQDSLTFSDTVANNIGCGDSSFSLPQIIEAAKMAHAHQFVQKLPYGYETPLGSGGQSLRPGEQFRIALARAFLRDPSVLIVEEPTQPYDTDSMALIDDALTRFQPGRTVVILTRHSSTVKSADRVFMIQAGKLVVTNQAQPHA